MYVIKFNGITSYQYQKRRTHVSQYKYVSQFLFGNGSEASPNHSLLRFLHDKSYYMLPRKAPRASQKTFLEKIPYVHAVTLKNFLRMIDYLTMNVRKYI